VGPLGLRSLALLDSWPVPSAAAGVVGSAARDGPPRLLDQAGEPDRVFAWASVTKLLVAMAVLLAVEEETLSIDQEAGPPGSTIRHLLAHASGLGPDGRTPLAPPGSTRIYSSIGYEILADTLATAAGMSFTDYLGRGVVTPLGLTATTLAPGASPASGAIGPLGDLLVLAGEFLSPRLLSPATLALATTVAFPGLRGVLPGYGLFDPCDWGLGPEIKGAKTPHWTGTLTSPATFGHFGRSGAFLWVDPTLRLATASLAERDFGPWAVTAWTALSDAVVEEWARRA
jgi:CubicO group peptidase (beta-lactamase class C family)